MRLYLGHRLPLGFFGGVAFGTNHPRSIVHRDGSATELKPVPGIWIAFWFVVGFIGVPLLVSWLR